MTKNYQKTQENEFGQSIGISLSPSKSAWIETQDILGQYVKLICIAGQPPTMQQCHQLWNSLKAEPNQSCWTYLPYTGFDTEKSWQMH